MLKPLTYLFFYSVLLAGFIPAAQAQLCTAGSSLGDPVVNITFGSGPNPGPPLTAATTAYQFLSSSCPNDGFYTLTNATIACFSNSWHTVTTDHTGNRNGYFMLVNASIQPNDFYLETVHNLCSNTTYEFAAWILNMMLSSGCTNGGIRPNITFSIETTAGVVLKTFNTGDIPVTSGNTWTQYGLNFTTPANAFDVVLRMTNNAPGGCGNDLALDDITFRPCGPKVTAGIPITGRTASKDFCIDNQVALGFDGTVSTGYVSPAYQWQVSIDTGVSWTDIPGATITSYTRLPTAGPGLYEYRLAVAENANIGLLTCRVPSNPIIVTVHPKPVPAAKNDGPVCAGSPLRLIAGDGSQNTWTGPGGFTATGGDTLFIPAIPLSGAGVYQVLVTSSAGCTQTDATTVMIFPVPVGVIGTGLPACEKNGLPFSDQSIAPVGQTLLKWYWDFGDGSVDSVQNPVHTYSAAGTYPVGLKVTTNLGCQNQPFTKDVVIHDLPQPDFTLPEICLADPSAVFIDVSTIPDNSHALFSWSWDFGDAAASSPGNPNSSGLKDPSHKYSAAGPYNVRLTVTSKDGCVKDTLKTFTVNGSNPVAAFKVENGIGLCSNQPVIFTDEASVNPGNIIRMEIYWDYMNDPGANTTNKDPVQGTQYPHTYPYFSAPPAQDYQVRYVVYSGITCMQQTTQIITIQSSPEVQFDALDPVCEEVAPFLITQAKELHSFAGTGVYSGNGISPEGLFDPRQATPGVDTLHYTFTAANSCFAVADQHITVYPQPKADAGPDQHMLEGGYTILQGSGSGNSVSYFWTPDSAIDNRKIPTPRVTPSSDIDYSLMVTSKDGCVDSSQVHVYVLKTPIVPNAFSPNGDGINDTWVIRYLDEYPGAEVQVFNRYGQQVFHSIGYTNPWNGTINGQPLPVATYYWVINPRNGRKQMNGSVTILR
ncbi:PKD domain-containing protein [Flavitalea flava]